MRAYNISANPTQTWPRREARHIAVALTVCALAVPASASAVQIGSEPGEPAATGYSSVTAITGASSDSSQPACYSDSACSDTTAVNAPTGGSKESADVDSGYSSLNAITGAPAETPTFVSSSPTGSGDGFDWASALVGGGVALALAALGGAALLTVRRRSPVTPSASTS
jgi:hypothetical protein